jgi:hypothetical protein
VILLEIEPEKQNKIDCNIDTWYSIVCVTEIIKRKATILQNESGHEVLIKRIYNRAFCWT